MNEERQPHRERQPGSERRPYRRPHLRTIDLVAEEVLGVGCKTDTGNAPGQPCTTLNCATVDYS